MKTETSLYKPHSLAHHLWPEYYQTGWKKAFQKSSLFEKPGLASHWRKHTIRKNRAGFGIALHFQMIRGKKSQDEFYDLRPEELFTTDTVFHYYEELTKTNSLSSIRYRLQELYDVLLVITPYLPKSHWVWLKNAWKNIRQAAKPVRLKLPRIKEAKKIEALGLRLMKEAEQSERRNYLKKTGLTKLQAAQKYRDGLAIALLIRRPFRIKNFYSLELNKNIFYENNTVSFSFEGIEMKNNIPIDIPFPPNLIPHLQRYLSFYRPILLTASIRSTGEHTNALWISGYGRAISEDRFRKMICQRTDAEFGVKITPHFFRDSDVTTLTRDAPSSARLIGPILGHRGVDIANKHYNQSLMIDASRRHTSLLEELIENSEEI